MPMRKSDLKLSFRSVLVTRMGLLLLLTLFIVGAYTISQVHLAGQRLSERVIRQTSALVDQRVAAQLDKAETHAQVLASIIRPSLSPSRNLPLDSNSFDEIAPQLKEVASSNPEFGTIALILDRTGEQVEILHPPGSTITVKTTQVIGNNQMVRKEFVPFGDRLIDIFQKTEPFIDPRKSLAYSRCKEAKSTIWTKATVVTDGRTTPLLGITCATPVYTGTSDFKGVVTISFTLSEIGRFLDSLKVGDNGFAFLVQYDDQGSPRVIAGPGQLIPDQSGMNALGFGLNQIPEGPLHQMVQEVGKSATSPSSDIREVQFQVNGQTYVGGFTRITGERRPDWLLCLVVPQTDFFVSSKETLVFFATIAVITLIVGGLISYLLAERVARPLRRLAQETGKITSLEFDDQPLPESNIREVDQLNESVETMKTGLRSMEKLVPTEYARYLIQTGQEAKLGGERRFMTTSFGDIVGFTKLSGQLPPEELVLVLSDYLDVLSSQVIAHGGTLDKFNGDDVMAFWGAPNHSEDHPLLAVQCALRSITAMHEMHDQWKKIRRPTLSAAFGISSGDVIVGNVGNKLRMNYTVIGDSVNLASRLQGINKFYGTHILIGAITAEHIDKEVLCRPIDFVEVLGREEPAMIFEPLAMRSEATKHQITLAALHSDAFESYQRRTWQKAAKKFEAVLAHSPDDPPARNLLDRCRTYLENPPGNDWNGAYEMKWK